MTFTHYAEVCAQLPLPIFVTNTNNQLCYFNAAAQQAVMQPLCVGQTLPVPLYTTQGAPLVLLQQNINPAYTVHWPLPAPATDTLQNDFVANVSHELRTPLTAVLGIVETLLTTAKDDPAATAYFLPLLQGQTRRMTKLVNGLLALATGEKRRNIAPKTKLDLSLVAREALAGIQISNPSRQIIDELPATPQWVMGDHDDLVRVVQNLLENALKYGHSYTPVVLSESAFAAPTANMVGIAVRDQGDGIAADILPRLTERFFRADAARSRQSGTSGAGLGLSLVQSILTRHKGVLVPHSTLGVGSEFAIWLPKAND